MSFGVGVVSTWKSVSPIVINAWVCWSLVLLVDATFAVDAGFHPLCLELTADPLAPPRLPNPGEN